jgi:peptidoglycan/LPS O-acetylase OafA/YrhL
MFQGLFWVALLLVSLYLGSWPVTGSASSPGYRTLTAMTPSSHQGTDASVAYFWCSIASVQLLFVLENFELLQKPFSSAVARYMGDVSFSLYIAHVPIFLSIRRVITVGLIRWTSHFTLGVCLGGITLLPVLICVSDLCWRVFDQPSVTFSSWSAGYFLR